MPLETASTVKELVPSNPSAVDEIAQGDDHIRMIKQVLVNDFGALDGAFTKTVAEIEAEPPVVPYASKDKRGSIRIWTTTESDGSVNAYIATED